MYIYSEYHDEFFELDGRARNVVKFKVILRSVVERYIPEEDIVDVNVVRELELNGIYVAEVLIELRAGVTFMFFVDSPIPLSVWQWQEILDRLNAISGYMIR